MDKHGFYRLVDLIAAAYISRDKILIKDCMTLAKELLLIDGEINTERCREMINSTPLRLAWIKKENLENKECLAVKYKDMAIEFYSTDVK